ncbi:class I SAM-dependent methyltransferase [Candidatus Saccharibacteria bacterium]|nr:class I SAM-dependent methyltransferase [Candidatus Saccharibacteria bacterium]
MIRKEIGRRAANTISGIRRYHNNKVRDFATDKRKKKILEVGSGIKRNGYYYYSMKRFFDESNTFLQTDVNKDFGHTVLDVTKMKYRDEFDIILCLNVLEHVYDFQKAVDNIYKSLKKNGIAVIAVPTFYPLHDEPGDYWRFTEHALRKILGDFRKVKLEYKGIRQYPYTYYIEARK